MTETVGSQSSPSELTRIRLYDLVWSKPLHTVAKELGLTRPALNMLCVRSSVPIPPVGYWAKKRSGKSVRRKSLPNKDGVDDDVAIEIAKPKPKPKPKPSPPAVPNVAYDDDVADALLRLDMLGEIEVSRDDSAALHPMARQARSSLLKQARELKSGSDYYGQHGSQAPALAGEQSQAVMGRALRLLDAFVRAAKALRFGVKDVQVDPWRIDAIVVLLDVEFSFRFRERLTSRRYDPKKDKPGRWPPKTVTEPSGLVIIERRGKFHYDPRRFLESKAGGLDGRIAHILRSTIKQVQESRLRDARIRIRAEQAQLEAIARAKEAEGRRLRARREAALFELVDQHSRAMRLRVFIAACRDQMQRMDADELNAQGVAEWVAWAEEVAAHVDPIGSDLPVMVRRAWAQI